jgi:SAM-dependent methyltransferase
VSDDVTGDLADWVVAPNISGDAATYELENEALARDGRLDEALRGIEDWSGRRLLDIGCGTGFWLPRYAADAAHVVGVEPDPTLVAAARERTAGLVGVTVLRGSAEHLPLQDASVDLAHARFAYFFGAGAEAGIEEAVRVLRPGGTLVVVDNDWGHGEFAELLRDASGGNADLDPRATDRWWRERGAERVDVRGAWRCRSPEELERVLRLEFGGGTVDRYLARHPGRRDITYGFALFVLRT